MDELNLEQGQPDNFLNTYNGPQPFSLERHSRQDKQKIVDEIMSKVNHWDTSMSSFFGEWTEIANSVRMIPRKPTAGKPRGLFNSVSGETRRAVITLANLWFRMLTASDPYIELYSTGSDTNEELLYLARQTLLRQAEVLKFKPKLMKGLTSLAAFGTSIAEEPFVQYPIGGSDKFFEGTDFQHRSLLLTGYNPYVPDIDFSDYIFTIDFFNKFKLRDIANLNNDVWDRAAIEKAIKEMSDNWNKTEAYSRMLTRRQRAGYNDSDSELFELVNYHGRLDLDNPIFDDYWQSNGRPDDIRFTDWTCGVLNGSELVRFHSTAFRSWKSVFKVASVNQFELEPLGYGVGKTGKRLQRELDSTQSRTHDALAMAIYTMWKVGKFAGLNSSQLQIKPFNVIQLDDIDQLQQLKIDLQTITQALAMQGIIKEDFRALTQASSNLQAVATGGTATEASLAQTEAIRGNSVTAELIAETWVREHFETCHINNITLLENPLFVNRFSGPGTIGMNRYNLPPDIGVRVKVTTDKDYAPERLKKVLETLNLVASTREIIPDSINALEPLLKEAFRLMGLDPRLLRQPKPMADLLSERMQRLGKSNALGGAEDLGEAMGGMAPSAIETPIGPVPTSPLSSDLIQGA